MTEKTAKRHPNASHGRDDALWNAIVARDGSLDGRFVYSVATTGVYCRPSCGARRPKRENVAFHDSPAAAEAAGFRACKRCSPNGTAPSARQARLVTEACRAIEKGESVPSLGTLASAAGLSPYHFHRLFRSVVGMSPKAYASAHRQQQVREALRNGRSVTQSAFEAGFNSSSRFYANATEMLGMTPAAFRKGGAKETLRYACGSCSLGKVLVAMSGKGVCAILLGEDESALEHDVRDRFPKAGFTGRDRELEKTLARVIALLDEPARPFDVPLDIRGTAFQHRVWLALRKVPVGSTLSYAELARRIGKPEAVRAVAGACAANPIAVAVPCHRVVRADGDLSNYRWGIERKRALLAREKKEPARRG
jgi:AraC family transcriptional regulator of adaptative response/methylated-DNA-[protein]-cysteine methyltransferase